MKIMQMTGRLAILFVLAGSAVAQDVSHDMKTSTEKTGHAIRHTGTSAGKDTGKGLKAVGHGTKVGAKDTAKGVKNVAVKTGSGVKHAVQK